MSAGTSGGNFKKAYPTAEQKRRLLELVDSDPELRSGKFSSAFTKKEAFRRWQAIAEDLNSISGTCKSGLEWRKTYQDKKSKAKKKAAVLRRSAQRVTGGGTPPPPLNDEEEFLLGSMSQETLVGHDTLESEAVFDMNSQMEVVEEVVYIDPLTEQERCHDESLPVDAGAPVAASEVAPMRESSRVGLPRTRTSAQRRLQSSIDTAKALKDSMATKIAIKEKFYTDFMQEMKKYTEAVTSIAESLAKIANK